MKLKGWMIGAIMGFILFLLFNGLCLKYFPSFSPYSPSFLYSMGIGGSGCSPFNWRIFRGHLIWFIVIPTIIGVLISKIRGRYKK